MLSIETMEQLSLLLGKIADLDKVILVSDVKTNNIIINTFISKRTKQILGLLENKCENVALCDTTSNWISSDSIINGGVFYFMKKDLKITYELEFKF